MPQYSNRTGVAANRHPGALRGRIEAQVRGVVDDGAGNVTSGPFETQFSCAAAFAPLTGSESVMSGRLQGKQVYIVTVRQSDQTRRITTDWRLLDARQPGRAFQVRTITDPDQKRQWLEILAEEGAVS